MSSKPRWHITFWQRFEKRGVDECWPWIGPLNRLGYGTIGRGKGKHDRAHRVSWELHNGPIPEGAHVLHSCDNRQCVNPAHLRLGTHTDNMRDMRERGRQNAAKGERNALSKLTTDQVLQIKARLADGEQGAKIARDFGVDKGTVSCIKRGKTWKHLAPEHVRDAANLALLATDQREAA